MKKYFLIFLISLLTIIIYTSSVNAQGGNETRGVDVGWNFGRFFGFFAGSYFLYRTLFPKEKKGNKNTNIDTVANNLIDSADSGQEETVNKLIKEGVDVNSRGSDGKTALILASYSGHTNIVKSLIKNGSNINAKMNNGSTALVLAAQQGHYEICDTLIKNKADVNAKAGKRSTPLVLAKKNGHNNIINLLRENGAIV